MKIFSWGCNSHGQLGQGVETEQLNEPLDFNINCNVKSIVGGGKHAIIVSSNGSLFSCGDNSQGQLSRDQNIKYLLSFELIDFKIKIIRVSCGWDFNLGLSEEGQVFGWGGNSFGQLGVPKEEASFLDKPTKVFPGKALDIGAGLRHSVIVTGEGSVFSCGFGRKGQLGIQCSREKKILDKFTQVPSIKSACKISCGENHCVLYTNEGVLYSWGDNKFGQLGISPDCVPFSELPVQVDCKIKTGVKKLLSGWSHNAILTVDGKVILWGRNDYGQLGEQRNESWKPKFTAYLTDIKQIVLGSNHCIALKGNDVLCWGWNEHGNCGNGSCDNIIYEPVVLKTTGYIPELIGTGSAHSFFCAK